VLIDPDAWIRELNGDQIEELGDDEREHVEMELVRRARATTARTADAVGYAGRIGAGPVGVRSGWTRHIRKRLGPGGGSRRDRTRSAL
jgi:hypothetical protein